MNSLKLFNRFNYVGSTLQCGSNTARCWRRTVRGVGGVPDRLVHALGRQIAMKAFDGLNRLKMAIKAADAITSGIVEETVVVEAPKALPLLPKRHTVYKKLGGIEKPIAFGLTSVEAADFMVVAVRRMITAEKPNTDGDPYFEVTTFRAAEEV